MSLSLPSLLAQSSLLPQHLMGSKWSVDDNRNRVIFLRCLKYAHRIFSVFYLIIRIHAYNAVETAARIHFLNGASYNSHLIQRTHSLASSRLVPLNECKYKLLH